MNGRILELAQNPELIQLTDLDLLKKEITKHPYIQSLRALYLVGTHRLNPENYAHELSITAAYTTDKKILYQLINSKGEEKVQLVTESDDQQNIIVDVDNTSDSVENLPDVNPEESHEKYTAIESKEVELPGKVYVNGELNRILFPGEEDFLTREPEVIDLESTLESGKIVTQQSDEKTGKSSATISDNHVPIEETNLNKIPEIEILNSEKIEVAKSNDHISGNDNSEISTEILEIPETSEIEGETPEAVDAEKFGDSSVGENFTKEKIIHEEDITAQKEVITDSAKLSFHGLDEFLPEVKIESQEPKALITKAPKPSFNKHEEEMKRLIAEVEAKMKSSKKVKTETPEDVAGSAEVNFSETQSFEIIKDTEITPSFKAETNPVEKTDSQLEKIASKDEEKQSDISPEVATTWKPMSFSTSISESQVSKRFSEKNIAADPIVEDPLEEIPSHKQDGTNDIEEVENEVISPQPEAAVEEIKDVEKSTTENTKTESLPKEESNIPNFINTWQSWLKIDRTDNKADKTEISITEIKNKVIENFIEKEPKISKLKEESDFVIKERTDDIWHLMTETLANLYVEQKLYAKAIKAFHVLSEKYPEKAAYFEDKIKEIKILRQNK
ncbi:hypothetical protein [Kaistella polysaccharea]|uniref:hypothetical protein n=1 Tax=Kaistella polysaccharea TaxID=2878534 RepID=UPI001CF49E1B|nr:hypothetical protein [Kaistella polysaccharea]